MAMKARGDDDGAILSGALPTYGGVPELQSLSHVSPNNEEDEGTQPLAFSSAATLAASAMGLGLLSMPHVCEQLGVGLFVIASLFSALISYQTCLYLARTALRGGVEEHSYAGVALHVFGSRMERAVKVWLVVQQFGACVGAVIAVGDVYTPLLQLAVMDSTVSEALVRLGCSLGIALPITLATTRDLHESVIVNALAVAAVSMLVLMIIPAALFMSPANDSIHVFFSSSSKSSRSGLWQGIPVICFSYFMHFNVLPVTSGLLHRKPERTDLVERIFERATRRAFALTATLTTSLGVLGYVTFGANTHADILTNFEVNHSSFALFTNTVRAVYGLGLLLTFPVCLSEMREIIVDWFSDGSRSAFRKITVALMVAISLVGAYIPDLSIVFVIVGATATPLLSFIFPSALYLRSGEAKHHQDEILPWVILAIGVALIPIGIMGIYSEVATRTA